MELPASLTLQQGGTGWIARHREPLFVEDISRDVRIMAADWALSRDLVAFAGAPVAVGGELLGVLTLNLKRGRLPEGNDRELLQSFAAQAAVAMNNARLFADNARLYEEAQQRLHALQETQAQLLQAAKLSAVGKLVSGVTHELNNPLSVVIGYGQLLLSRGVPDEIRRPLELMIAQGERMAKIVQGLMLFSRQRKPERRVMDVREVIDPGAGPARQPARAVEHSTGDRLRRRRAAGAGRRSPAAAGVPQPAAERGAGHPRQWSGRPALGRPHPGHHAHPARP
jgi:signal transduction histidine kinase